MDMHQRLFPMRYRRIGHRLHHSTGSRHPEMHLDCCRLDYLHNHPHLCPSIALGHRGRGLGCFRSDCRRTHHHRHAIVNCQMELVGCVPVWIVTDHPHPSQDIVLGHQENGRLHFHAGCRRIHRRLDR